MRWSVSALAPGVNGMMMLIGRDDSSSAAASLPAVALATKSAARTTGALSIDASWATIDCGLLANLRTGKIAYPMGWRLTRHRA
jgi:hypothetical protein